MNKKRLLKGALAVATAAMFPLSQAMADSGVSISGWINEGVLYYDDGVGSDVVQLSDNGTTLGSRITFAGSTDLPAGLNAGFEVIVEPLSVHTPLIFSNQSNVGDTTGDALGVLGSSVFFGGAWGKLTFGLQTMPTDNIAVLADPSLTLWDGISPVFRGNGFSIRGTTVPVVWGDFLNCLTAEGLQGAGGIGIDCNGIYRNGVRYDLPTFLPGVSIAVGYANDEVYDVAGKWDGQLGRLKALVHLGYAQNNNVNSSWEGNSAENFQVQGGLMDPVTGLFGSIAYQNEQADSAVAGSGDDTDAWWLKVGIKKAFNSLGDTSLAFDYGNYNDQFGNLGVIGVTGSEVERWGVAIDQYFGSKLIIYGKYENLGLNIDGSAAAHAALDGAKDLETFTLGLTYFF